MTEASVDVPVPLGSRLREAVTDALRYWEPRRVVFNAVLAAIVMGYFVANWPHSRTVVSFEGVLFVFILVVLVNICYCAAYLGDVFVQLSGVRETWRRVRWVLFVTGLAFAAIITRWFAMGFFNRPPTL
jgi:hypothetical protein